MASVANLREQVQNTLGTIDILGRELGGAGMVRVHYSIRSLRWSCVSPVLNPYHV